LGSDRTFTRSTELYKFYIQDALRVSSIRCHFCAFIFHRPKRSRHLPALVALLRYPQNLVVYLMSRTRQSHSFQQGWPPKLNRSRVATRCNPLWPQEIIWQKKLCVDPAPSDSLQVKVWTDKDSRNGCRMQLCGSFVPEAKLLSVWRIRPSMLELPRSCWIEHSTD
jgi:hypothetical protein